MHLLYLCIIHLDYFIFLYADIYLISSARNKDIMLSPIKLFSSFALTPTQTGKTDDYIHEGNINIHIACISIFNSKGSFEHQHEHELCIRFDLDILEREEETENIYGAKRYVSVWLDR